MKTEPTKLSDQLMNLRSDLVQEYGISIEFQNRIGGAFNAALDYEFPKDESSPKIKQLEWNFYGTYYSAETPVIDYMITQENDFSSNDGVCALWVNGFPSQYDSIEEAKAAAQADFCSRVKGCLE